MEEIANKVVEIELDCESGVICYRVITYYKNGIENTETRFMSNVEENVEDIVQILDSGDLEFMIEDALLY